jgi:hypothetical protein
VQDRNLVRITTDFQKNDVQAIDQYPFDDTPEAEELRKTYKFYCPICLRYFNHILVSDCCRNYICRLCIGW